MNRVIVAVAALLLLVGATKHYSLPDELEQWMTYYYLEPRPDEIPAALEAVTKKGFFENDNVQAPITGFFTEVFRANPDRLEGWVTPYVGVPNRHILYSGLWMANSKQSKAALHHLAEGALPEERKRLKELLSMSPPTIGSMDIDSPAGLDYMWGAFMASGAEEPVVRVISQMKLVNTKGNTGQMLVGGAAKWSVSANARQHQKVLKIVRAQAKVADPETKAMLEEIIKGIEAEGSRK